MAPNSHAVVSHMALDRAHSRRTVNGSLKCITPLYWTAPNHRGAMTASRESNFAPLHNEIILLEGTRLYVVPETDSHLRGLSAEVVERQAQLHFSDVDRRYHHSEVGYSHPC